jgi:uncharacterized protein
MGDWGVLRWIAAKLLRLPPRQVRRLDVVKDMPVTMRDGVALLTDRYYARGRTSGPVVLIRSCYGRSAAFGIVAGLMAERGLQVVLQSARGTGGSGGSFNPMRQEQADGADTLDWIRAQSWFSGKLFMFGPSYLGNVQWAMANGRADALDGLLLIVTLSNFQDELQAFGGFTLGGMLSWTQMMVSMIEAKPGERTARPNMDRLKHVFGHLPLGTIDHAAIGKTVDWWQDWINHDDPDDPWWRALDHTSAVPALAAPTIMVGGWQDIFLPFQIRDFETRRAAGREAWLTVGPWSHAAPGGIIEGLRQAVTTFSDIAAGRKPHEDRDRVRLYLQGAKEWREYSSWPPPDSLPLRFHFQSGGRLELAPPADGGSTAYVYDPEDPTPAVHGPKIIGGAKRRDMSELELRRDTIKFTSAALDRDCDVIGPVSVELSVRSDRIHTDFYACLCDVDAKGQSLQISDGYIRLRPGKPEADASGVRRIMINCWPTAYRFGRGHRLRLIIASGAHPRYARNLGTGEPLATGTRMVSARQEIMHDAAYGSALVVTISSDQEQTW